MHQEIFKKFTIAFQTYTASDVTTEVQKICGIIEQFHLTSNSTNLWRNRRKWNCLPRLTSLTNVMSSMKKLDSVFCIDHDPLQIILKKKSPTTKQPTKTPCIFKGSLSKISWNFWVHHLQTLETKEQIPLGKFFKSTCFNFNLPTG